MGAFAIGLPLRLASWVCATVIVSLNIKLVYEAILEWFSVTGNPLLVWCTAVPVAVAASLLLLYIIFQPLASTAFKAKFTVPHGQGASLLNLKKPAYSRIAVTVDFSPSDRSAIKNAVALGKNKAQYLLIHIVESVGALVMGKDIIDFETSEDKLNLERYAQELREQGFDVEIMLGYGNPKKRIPELVKDFNSDLLVMGSHGHKMVKDLIYGETINTVRHSVEIPVLIVKA